jgi:hypothetical protein
MTLTEKAISLGVMVDKSVRTRLRLHHCMSVQTVADELNAFLERFKGQTDAIYLSIDFEDNYGEPEVTVVLTADIPKSDDELQAEIDSKLTADHQKRTQQLDREYAEYLRLKAQFERKEQQ